MTWTAFAILAMFLPTCQTVTFFSTLLWLLSWDVKLAFTITFFENQLEDPRSRARNQKSKSDLMELWLNRNTSKASMQVSLDFHFNMSLNIFGGDLSLVDILFWAMKPYTKVEIELLSIKGGLLVEILISSNMAYHLWSWLWGPYLKTWSREISI